MKRITHAIVFEDGEWWHRGKNGLRQRAKINRCPTCGDEFADFPHGKTKVCSPECRRKACLRCGELFQPKATRTDYCSLECKRGKGICEECGKEYVYSHHGAKRFCSMHCFYENQVPVGTAKMDTSGYTITKVPPGTPGTKVNKRRSHWMWTHRYVMQEKLGRPLLKTEQVHHINGRKDDNRPENLELWKHSHPSGVRSSDYHCPGCRCFDEER